MGLEFATRPFARRIAAGESSSVEFVCALGALETAERFDAIASTARAYSSASIETA